jgi:hypothetical protein
MYYKQIIHYLNNLIKMTIFPLCSGLKNERITAYFYSLYKFKPLAWNLLRILLIIIYNKFK